MSSPIHMTKAIVVFDVGIEQFFNNRIFDAGYAVNFPGSQWAPVLYRRLLELEWDMMTADIFLKKNIVSIPAFCLSHSVTPFTKLLLDRGVLPSVLMCGESPNVDRDFYHNLTNYARRYKYAFLFRGVRDHINPPTKFYPFYWPNAQHNVLSGAEWQKRDFLVMVAGNKQRFSINPNKPFAEVRRLAKKILWLYLQNRDPIFKLTDLYQKRLEAILYFSATPGFRLYGTGWESPNGISPVLYETIKKLKPSQVNNKLQTMYNFKIALCFENCIFPGYVTEKIFDCFFAGCIPIYLGAPDITDFVPANAFIDFRNFETFKDLEEYIATLSEDESRRYLDAAKDFIGSSEFNKFRQETFIDKLLLIFNEELAIAGSAA